MRIFSIPQFEDNHIGLPGGLCVQYRSDLRLVRQPGGVPALEREADAKDFQTEGQRESTKQQQGQWQ